jgi:hypothetical protein
VTPDLENALTAIVKRTIELAAADKEVQVLLRRLAEAFLAATAPRDEPATAVDGEASAEAEVGPQAVMAPSAEPQPVEVLTEAPQAVATGVEATPPPPVEQKWPARWMATTDEDLAAIEEACRMKAEGARWAATPAVG